MAADPLHAVPFWSIQSRSLQEAGGDSEMRFATKSPALLWRRSWRRDSVRLM